MVVIASCMMALLDEPVYQKFRAKGKFVADYETISNMIIATGEIVRIVLTTLLVKEIAEAEETVAKWGILDLLIVLVMAIVQLKLSSVLIFPLLSLSVTMLLIQSGLTNE